MNPTIVPINLKRRPLDRSGSKHLSKLKPRPVNASRLRNHNLRTANHSEVGFPNKATTEAMANQFPCFASSSSLQKSCPYL